MLCGFQPFQLENQNAMYQVGSITNQLSSLASYRVDDGREVVTMKRNSEDGPRWMGRGGWAARRCGDAGELWRAVERERDDRDTAVDVSLSFSLSLSLSLPPSLFYLLRAPSFPPILRPLRPSSLSLLRPGDPVWPVQLSVARVGRGEPGRQGLHRLHAP
eukprot:1574790-Rhodomonas_salina.1